MPATNDDIMSELRDSRADNRAEHKAITDKLQKHAIDAATLKTKVEGMDINCKGRHTTLNRFWVGIGGAILIGAAGFIIAAVSGG